MKTEDLSETLDSLLAHNRDKSEEGINRTSPSLCQVISYEHERFLVAWVLLSRFPQEQLDRAWLKYGIELSRFASSLLINFDSGIDIIVDDHDVSKTNANKFFYACCIRLVAQVTARLTKPPSKELRHGVFNSWKHFATLTTVRDMAKISSPREATKLHSTIVALSIDVFTALVSWVNEDNTLFSSDVSLNDIWNIPIAAHTKFKQLAPVLEQENHQKLEGNTSKGVKPNFHDNERAMMIYVVESLLGSSSEAHKIGASEEEGDEVYTITNLQRLIFVIFELQGTECVSDELVRSILLCTSNSQVEMSDPDLRILWDEWLMKNIGNRISENTNDTNLLRDPKVMDAIQRIILAHAVSPNTNALRSMAWQSISQITKSFGWNWIQKSSTKTTSCTWCRLACGEWKIQLEDKTSERSNRLSILDGCGSLIIQIVQFLVDFDECPSKKIPLTTDSVVSIRQALEETLSLTSVHLIALSPAQDDIESAITINVWSALFSEIDLSTSNDITNVMACFQNLLLVSSDESLVQALVHVVSSYLTEQQIILHKDDRFNNTVTDSIVIYLKRYWRNMVIPDFLKRCSGKGVIDSACVATEILAEHKPQGFQDVVHAIFEALGFLVNYIQMENTQHTNELTKNIRPILDTCLILFKDSDNPLPERTSFTISSAIKIVEGADR